VRVRGTSWCFNLQRFRERRAPLVAHSPVEGQIPKNRKQQNGSGLVKRTNNVTFTLLARFGFV
jgi:hypothetical protein